MATNKRKKTTAIVAGVTALALLLGGTFAWTSISQQAKNETAGIVNVGGRLHDDFNGTNKDVYVENFTDPLNGGQPIYARVRLDEYMEVGKEAGGIDVDGDNTIDAVPVITDTDRDDVKTWKPHIPAELCEECDSGDTCVIHEHWQWTMGGQGENGGQTTFMPTFNKDKDSLAADINGTYHGTDDTDKVYYDDYVVYTTDNTADGVGVDIAEDAKESHDGSIYSVIGTELYDDDTDTEDNGGVRQVENVTHTAKETAEGSVITMDEWINIYDKAPGNYWVYDTDGWAYWANPIMPGEATGLLLDGIEMTKNPGEKCYYAINVVGQFATVGDWEYFDEDNDSQFDGTDEAKTLLETVSKNVATVTVTNKSGTANVDRGATVEFEASVSVNGTQVLAASDFDWSVLNADLTENTTSTITDGVLTVGEKEAPGNLIIVAKAKDGKYPGAVGMSAIGVNKPPIPEEIAAIAGVTAGSTTKVTIDNTEWYVLAKQDGKALIWTADILPDSQMPFDIGDGASNLWETSDVRTYLNGEYFDSLNVLKEYVVPTTIYTANTFDRTATDLEYIETEDKVFLLSEADVKGDLMGYDDIPPAEEFTYGTSCIVPDALIRSSDTNWTRSPCNEADWLAVIQYDGRRGTASYNDTNGFFLRPAMWVKYAPDIEVSVTVPDVEFNEYNSASVKDGTQITFQATATADGKPMENPEFVYELYNTTYEDTFLEEGAITSDGVWNTTGYGPSSPGFSYYAKVYVKGYPDEYVKLGFLVQP